MVDFRKFYKEKANVAYAVMGYPSLEVSGEFIKRLGECGVDILELGVPYSDPIADGELIAQAAARALELGVGLGQIFELLERVETDKALVFMVYYNVIFSYGLRRFVREAKRVGICGLIVPELSFEESGPLREECDSCGIALITLVSVTTPKERMKKLVKNARGFIYLLSYAGLTGGKSGEYGALERKVAELREMTSLPIFVGFGVKDNADVRAIHKIADGAIVGTSVVREFESEDVDLLVERVGKIFKA
ncbi:tryptophan synthase subunit alpha [Campylobacter sp.]|uniref:tryptophan synthase subunit alpha n=1 Tax=Campylobacter sp. TaxID=205 RepID=UPI0026DB4A63|nr:tryptophan synthase subunit alpha [Campylobacter sp.]MDO4674092.1 tryptophan synthase subunit alpha [Campylobacter sp.]